MTDFSGGTARADADTLRTTVKGDGRNPVTFSEDVATGRTAGTDTDLESVLKDHESDLTDLASRALPEGLSADELVRVVTHFNDGLYTGRHNPHYVLSESSVRLALGDGTPGSNVNDKTDYEPVHDDLGATVATLYIYMRVPTAQRLAAANIAWEQDASLTVYRRDTGEILASRPIRAHDGDGDDPRTWQTDNTILTRYGQLFGWDYWELVLTDLTVTNPPIPLGAYFGRHAIVATDPTIDALEDRVDSAEGEIEAAEEDIVLLKRATGDILVNTKTKSTGFRDANSDGSEGGIAFGPTWDLTKAQAATYTAPKVAAAAATGAALIRIPLAHDARHYVVVIVGLGSDVLSHLAIREFSDANYQYWEAANFQGEFAVTLRYNPTQITVTTEWDGKLGDNAVGSIAARNRTLLMSKTDTAANWHNSGSGQNLPAGVNKKIFDGFSGTRAEAWSELVVNVKYTESGNPAGTDHFGSIHMGTQLDGGQTSDNKSKIYGAGRIDGAELHCRIDLPQRTSFNSNTGKIMINGASFAQTGNEMLEVKMWGVR